MVFTDGTRLEADRGETILIRSPVWPPRLRAQAPFGACCSARANSLNTSRLSASKLAPRPDLLTAPHVFPRLPSSVDIVGHLSCLDKKPHKAFRFRGAHLKFSGLSPAERDAVADIVTINPFATARGLPY
jgi:hypothetical protein